MQIITSLKINSKYLTIPNDPKGITCVITLMLDSKVWRVFDITLGSGDSGFMTWTDVSEVMGKEIDIYIDVDEKGEIPHFAISQSDSLPINDSLYKEELRPQIHFSAMRGWINDPNGLVYENGRYHMFYQHNPYGSDWGNMHWGHAVSKDLLHWNEVGEALYPDETGTMFSGCGIIDTDNLLGFGNDTIVLYYTASGEHSSRWHVSTQCMAYSNDGGVTFNKYKGNPVVSHIAGHNRDPKVVRVDGGFIMALYLEGNEYVFLFSDDMVNWNEVNRLNLSGCTECPDIFPLAVDGDENNIKWVFWGANSAYAIGELTASGFIPESDVYKLHHGRHSYAAQTFSDIPKSDGRCIQMTWNTFQAKDMLFNCSMTFPLELTLKTTKNGVRLHGYPIAEIDKLCIDAKKCNKAIITAENPIEMPISSLCDIDMKLDFQNDSEMVVNIAGLKIECSDTKLFIDGLSVDIDDGIKDLRILKDVAGLELFINGGVVFMSVGHVFNNEINTLSIISKSGTVEIMEMSVKELCSIW